MALQEHCFLGFPRLYCLRYNNLLLIIPIDFIILPYSFRYASLPCASLNVLDKMRYAIMVLHPSVGDDLAQGIEKRSFLESDFGPRLDVALSQDV